MGTETARQAFVREATHALLHSGFTPPVDGEASVLLFDSTPWRFRRADAYALLDTRERERALRFHYPHDRDTYVLAHAFWRVVLGIVLDTDAANVSLTSTAAGQPCLPHVPHATSLSHSGSHVAIAVGIARTLGIDIEQSPPHIALHGIAQILCSPAEAAALEAMPAAAREHALLSLWTRKEALLKAFGIGLRESPSAIRADIGVGVDPPASVDDAPTCLVHQLDLPETLVGALAAPLSVTRLSLHWIDPSHAGDDMGRAIA
ncbi:4'-phosphopantetheinyl transferase family protein [Dyella soli]|nr:4'-phosphopantetheinyl transferase superfamily protein [Dyella soli]